MTKVLDRILPTSSQHRIDALNVTLVVVRGVVDSIGVMQG